MTSLPRPGVSNGVSLHPGTSSDPYPLRLLLRSPTNDSCTNLDALGPETETSVQVHNEGKIPTRSTPFERYFERYFDLSRSVTRPQAVTDPRPQTVVSDRRRAPPRGRTLGPLTREEGRITVPLRSFLRRLLPTGPSGGGSRSTNGGRGCGEGVWPEVCWDTDP